jgi:hypothetical protein
MLRALTTTSSSSEGVWIWMLRRGEKGIIERWEQSSLGDVNLAQTNPKTGLKRNIENN